MTVARPIDVMPDHPHEGYCFGPTFDVPDGEFPIVDGVKPIPEVVAYGTTLPAPPFCFEKGPQVFRLPFPMIVAYDGQIVDQGRIAVDSTWHHWLDMNLVGLSGDNLKKIERYHTNVAVWLASPAWRRHTFYRSLLRLLNGYFGAQECKPRASAYSVGVILMPYLDRIFGKCWTRSIIWDDVLSDLDWETTRSLASLTDASRNGDAIVSAKAFEAAIAGGVLKRAYARRSRIRPAPTRKATRSERISSEQLTEDFRLGIGDGLQSLVQTVRPKLTDAMKLLAVVEERVRAHNHGGHSCP